MNDSRQTPQTPAAPNHHLGAGVASTLGQDLKEAQQSVAPALHQLAEQASELARTGLHAVQAGSKQVNEQARRTGDLTLDYIRREPVKSVLMAAALGAVTMVVIDLLRHPSTPRR